MTITHHPDVTQGSDEWHALRCGMLTASEMKHIITPALKVADNEKSSSHLFELLGQRITGYVEPRYVSDDMLRGQTSEILARDLYAEKFAPVEECGFITNDELGFSVGYSPDGLVGEDGVIEVKGRLQKFQIETLINRAMPSEYSIQVQSALWVSGRRWCDFLSYCGGLPMPAIRVERDEAVITAIKSAARSFDEALEAKWFDYHATMASRLRMAPTERIVEQEMHT